MSFLDNCVLKEGKGILIMIENEFFFLGNLIIFKGN